MKKLVIFWMALAAVSALPVYAADAPFDEKTCMKKCTKGLTEKALNLAKEDAQYKGEKEDNKSSDHKVDKQAVKKQCEFICKGND
ncbi:MAG: hypothetical protein CFE44_10230 [Burkholderiales bacterium PBB4]|nr:MAG: hypothetical protein CFE44_10230 [Burkholderiales bacterium PBB4]